jgi:hypothetical protein
MTSGIQPSGKLTCFRLLLPGVVSVEVDHLSFSVI